VTIERDYIDYIEDIRDAIDQATRFIAGITYEQFLEDSKTVYAVIRALEVVGEATKCVPDSVRVRYPEVPWRKMAGMRDKLIHHYFGVNISVVWKTVAEELPALAPLIGRILAEIAEGES